MTKQFVKLAVALCAATSIVACNNKIETMENVSEKQSFDWQIDEFADIKVLRYQVPGFENLSLQQKKLIYYLSEAALCGRDIIWDQNFKHNLTIRRAFENIYTSFAGDKNSDDWKAFVIYLKQIWFANGIHHHYSMDKFEPKFSKEFLSNELTRINVSANICDTILNIVFDKNIAAKRVILDSDIDAIALSANNLYDGVTKQEATDFYNNNFDLKRADAPEWGLNSKLIKKDGKIYEDVYKIGGLYGEAIEKIVSWLQKAKEVAENDSQRQVIDKLIEYYNNGDVNTFDAYNILWVKDTTSEIDFVNGFIEVYGDPIGRKGTWESIVNFKNNEATHRTEILSDSAQWFESHSPIDNKFKKENVKGVTAKVINVAILAGDCYPATPIGINLPNNGWIRKEHGSKSVTIENIMFAYDQSSQSSGVLEEFAYSQAEVERAKKYNFIANSLHVDMHECLGHGSGIVNNGITTDDLQNYYSTIEEARADLFALYYAMDEKLVELGLQENLEVGMAEYDSYIKGGLLTQLKRVELGKNIEEAHMRNRQLICKWVFEKGANENVIEKKNKDGKTFFVINDYFKLRQLFGDLLREIQRIKSEGDFEGAKFLVETYGVKVDFDLHKEVLARFEKLNNASFSGFVNPIYTPIYKNGEIVDIQIDYSESYIDQMLRYSQKYSYLK